MNFETESDKVEKLFQDAAGYHLNEMRSILGGKRPVKPCGETEVVACFKEANDLLDFIDAHPDLIPHAIGGVFPFAAVRST